MWAIISQRYEKDKRGDSRDNLEDNYTRYLESLGVHLVPISNTARDVSVFFEKLPIEGVILSGGGDVDPRLYGQEPSSLDAISAYRDETENKLITLAIEMSLPMLGICRGMQKINVFFGGSLIQNINKGKEIHPPKKDHSINITYPPLANILGMDSAEVNSYHDHAVTLETLSPKLKSFALCESSGIVEGVYHPELPIAGIQWHPERKSPDNIINGLIINSFKKRSLFWDDLTGGIEK